MNNIELIQSFTLEGKVVRLSDKIAYIHHDMDDAIRGGILTDKTRGTELVVLKYH